jgi:hypothetical protein
MNYIQKATYVALVILQLVFLSACANGYIKARTDTEVEIAPSKTMIASSAIVG